MVKALPAPPAAKPDAVPVLLVNNFANDVPADVGMLPLSVL